MNKTIKNKTIAATMPNMLPLFAFAGFAMLSQSVDNKEKLCSRWEAPSVLFLLFVSLLPKAGCHTVTSARDL
jgi:hypothetical protein